MRTCLSAVFALALLAIALPAQAQSPTPPETTVNPLALESLGSAVLGFEITTEQLSDSQRANIAARGVGVSTPSLSVSAIPGAGSGQYASIDGQLSQADQPTANFVDELGFFVNGTGGYLAQEGNSSIENDVGLSVATSGALWSLTVGGDYRVPYEKTTDQGQELVNDLVTFGLAFSVGQVNQRRDLIVDSTTTSYDFVGYGIITPFRTIYIDIIAGIGHSTIDYERNTSLGFVDGNLRGNRVTASASIGYDFDVYNGLVISPFIGMDYSETDYIGFDESGLGTNPEARDFGDFTVLSLTTSVGGQLSYAFSRDFGVVQPYLRGQHVHEFNDGEDITTRDALGATTVQRTRDPDQNYAIVSGGVVTVLGSDWSINAQVEAVVLNRDQLRIAGTAGVSKRF